MKKLLTLILIFCAFKVSAQTFYQLPYDSVRTSKTPTSSTIIPDKLWLKGVPKGLISVRADGKVIHNDTIYTTLNTFNTTIGTATQSALDTKAPISGGSGYIWNGTSPQTANLNITGTGTFQQITTGRIYSYLIFAAFGDSITQGYLVTPNSNRWVNKIGAALNIPYTNYGVGGKQAADMGEYIYPFNVSSTASQLITYGINTNDALVYGSNTDKQQTTAECDLAMVAYLAIPDSLKLKGQGSGITYGGTWSNSSNWGGAITKASTTNGSTATATLYGSTLYIAYGILDGNGGTFSVYVDGVLIGNYSAVGYNGSAILTNTGGTKGSALLRIPNLTATNHTVVITVTSATNASNQVFIDWLGSNQPSSNKIGGPAVFVADVPRMNAVSDAITQKYSAISSDVVSMLAGDGLNVTFVPMSAYINPATDLDVDGIHINNRGSNIYSQVELYYMNGLNNAYTKQGAVNAALLQKYLNISDYSGALTIKSPTITASNATTTFIRDNSATATAFNIDQKQGSGDILNLKFNGTNQFRFNNSGTFYTSNISPMSGNGVISMGAYPLIYRTAADSNPILQVVQGNASSTGALQSWAAFGFAEVAKVLTDGTFRAAAFGNFANTNSSLLTMGSGGATISTNVSGNTGLTINLNNTGGSNPVVAFQAAGTTISTIDKNGTFKISNVASQANPSNGVLSMGNYMLGYRNIADSSPTFSLQTVHASATGPIQNWINSSSSEVAKVLLDGTFRGAGISNLASSNNSTLQLNATGLNAYQNLNDANPAFIINKANASATGHIADFQFNASLKSWVDKDGVVNGTGVRASALSGIISGNSPAIFTGIGSILGKSVVASGFNNEYANIGLYRDSVGATNNSLPIFLISKDNTTPTGRASGAKVLFSVFENAGDPVLNRIQVAEIDRSNGKFNFSFSPIVPTPTSGTDAVNKTYADTKMANPMTTAGDIIYGGASGVPARLASNSSATRYFLSTASSGNPSYFNLFGTSNTWTGQQIFGESIFIAPSKSLQFQETGGSNYIDIITSGATAARQQLLSDAAGNIPVVNTNTAPSSSTDTGKKGEIRVVGGFAYICTATDTWVRIITTTIF